MSDHMISADELREVIDKWEGREITSDTHLLYREVEALLPAPPAPRTMAEGDVPELDRITGRTHAERVLSHSLAQAEQIETLSRLLAGAEEAATERAAQIVRLQAAVRELTHDPHWLTVVGVLREGDMK